MKRARLIVPVIAAIALAACGDSPMVPVNTSPDQHKPSYSNSDGSGGLVFGSGNRSDADTTSVSATADTGSDQRGGLVFGSGN